VIDAARKALDAVRAAELDDTSLSAAIDAWDEAWRVVVIGRVSAGKTSLVNTLTGSERPTGLGGVTRYAEEVPHEQVVFVDTSGIDGAALAIARLTPHLATADLALWVVDGLQPVTDTERRVIGAALPHGTTLDIIVSKLDIVGDESDEVIERVTALTTAWQPRSIQAGNPRRGAVQARPDWTAGSADSNRRRRALTEALKGLADRLELDDTAVVLKELSDRWRSTVRNAQQSVVIDIESGEIAFKPAALRALARTLAPAQASFVANLPALPGRPALPKLHPPDRDVLTALVDGLGGQESARKAVRATAADMLMEGMVALQEWVQGASDPRLQTARQAVANAASIRAESP